MSDPNQSNKLVNSIVYWIENFKKNPIIIIVIAIIGGLTFLNSTTDLFKVIYKNTKIIINPNDEDYKKVTDLKIGLSKEYVQDKLGKPAKIIDLCKAWRCNSSNNDLKFHIHDFTDYQVRVIYEGEGIEFYSVTLKNISFQPEITYLDLKLGKLGKVTFSDITKVSNPPIVPDDTTAFMGPKFGAYVEVFAPGPTANYKGLYLAWTPQGYGRLQFAMGPATDLSRDKSNTQQLQQFRENSQPNSYGVFDSNDGLGSEIGKNAEAWLELSLIE